MAISLLSWVNYWWMRIVGGGEKSIDDAMAMVAMVAMVAIVDRTVMAFR